MTYYKLICKGRWLASGWPGLSVMELDDDRYQTKVLEIFDNGKIGYAYSDIEVNGCFLAEGVYVTPEFLAEDSDIAMIPITKTDFDKMWIQYVNEKHN